MQLSQKEKTFSEFFFAFLKPILNFKDLQKKKWPSLLMPFWKCQLLKTLLDKCLKSRVSENP